MSRIVAFCILFLLTSFAFGQTFEADRGAYYFFSPTKHGYIGLSTVALNMGIGEYVSSDHTITTYDKSGKKRSNTAVDCRDGLTMGLANQKNEYSYLTSSFYNTKQSFFKLNLYRIDADADLNKVGLNVKSKFIDILGAGKYRLDIKYTFATHDAFLFVFSKYLDNAETFYLVKIKNGDDVFEIETIDLVLEDEAFHMQKASELRFAFDGENTFSVLQLQQKKGKYNVIAQEFKLNKLKSERIRNFELGFVGEDFFLSPTISEKRVVKTYESYVISSQTAENSLNNYVQYEYVNGDLAIVGLFYKKRRNAILEARADGLFMVKIDAVGDTVLIKDLNERLEFNYFNSDQESLQYAFIFNNFQFLSTLWLTDKKKLLLFEGGAGSSEVDLESCDPQAGLVYHFDSKKHIPSKYLTAKRSGIYQSVNSLYCLYDLRSNSVGYYTKLSIKEFE